MLLKKTKKLEVQIDEFLDKVLNGGLYLKQGLKYYLKDQKDLFEDTLNKIDVTENDADTLRRTIETKLYRHTLIPEQRGDVLGLLESTDKVLNVCKEILFQFSVENPSIPAVLEDKFMDLADTSISAVECMISAVRAYFTEIQIVRDYVNKTIFFEKESDKLADRLKREIFENEECELSRKMHIRTFAVNIEKIADAAEDVCDRLSIAVIKRYG
jgi:predicted phosphate transport protein (TIGR00153 family)